MGVRREWLVYNDSANIMKCNICQRYSANCSCSFVIGTSTMKLKSVKHHKRSNAHINATKIFYGSRRIHRNYDNCVGTHGDDEPHHHEGKESLSQHSCLG